MMMAFASYVVNMLAVKNLTLMQLKVVATWPNVIGHVGGSKLCLTDENATKKIFRPISFLFFLRILTSYMFLFIILASFL
jgi:hypothetical protein